jgi:hypothetical protein
MAVASTAGWVVGRLYDGTTRPLATMVAAMLFIAAIAFACLVRKDQSEER